MLFEQLEIRAVMTAVQSLEVLQDFDITGNVGEKPESKIWKYGGKWWGVFSDTVGSHVYRLDGSTWNKTLQLSTDTSIKVDVKSLGNLAHVFFENDLNSKLVSLEYVPGATPTYKLWTERPAASTVALASTVESATIDIDSTGRMWVVYDEQIAKIQVKYSDSPYTSWSEPIVIASNVVQDDISVITAFPDGKIGVMWSNQRTDRFGFRTHNDGDDPTVWSADEVPMSQSAIDGVGRGFADDHLNLAVASDGTLYAAVKTSYDLDPYPWVGIGVRRPNGTWDDFYGLPYHATRPAIQLNEAAQTLIFSYDDDFNWVYHECSTVTLVCGPQVILLDQGRNATSTKQNVTSDLVILTSGKSTGGNVNGARLTFNVPNSAPTANAGENQTLFAGQTANLAGVVDDDGLPEPPAAVTSTWSVVNGPGIVIFGDTSHPQTTAQFSTEGVYTLRLTANDGQLSTFDDVTIFVGQTPTNQPPLINAGPDLVIGIAQSPLLDGTVSDDGLPLSPGTVGTLWSVVNGPGTVTFGDSSAIDTTASFSALGTYTLRLSAFDGDLTSSDDIIVTVNQFPPNQAPVVNAGADQEILIGSSVTLTGSFSDDGLPVSAPLTATWSKVSGPGVVSFLNASELNTAANFSQPGTYVLGLNISDTELTGQDTVTITVADTPPSESLSFQDGVFPTPAYAGTRDSKTRSDQATTIQGSNNKLEVDGNPDFASYLKWDISSIPSESVVVGASFTVNVVNTTTNSFKIYEIVRDWLENQMTFNVSKTGVPWEIPGAQGATDRGNTVLGTITAPSLGQVTVNLNAAGIAVVQKWVSNPSQNHGLVIQDYTDAFTDDIDFNSREITVATNRPRLNVTYTTVPVNDPPFIGQLSGDVLPYMEDAGPQLIDQGLPSIVSDADSPDFAFGSLTVSIASGGVPAEDILAIRSAGDITLSSTEVKYQGTTIGTYDGGTNGEDLVVTFNLAANTSGVTALINALTFENTSQAPSTAQRLIAFTLIDGDGTANGGGDTTSVTATVNVIAVNDPPAILNIEDDELLYVENSGPQLLDAGTLAVVSDLDSADFGGGSMVVSLGSTLEPTEDVLKILSQGAISIASGEISFGGTVIGTATGGTSGDDLVVAFNSAATLPAVAELISALAYENVSDAPTTTSRRVSITLFDGDGTANGGLDEGGNSMAVSITPVNDPPAILELNGDTLTYVEGSGLLSLDQGAVAGLQDLDSVNLEGGTLTATISSGNVPAEDILSVRHTGNGAGQIGVTGSTVSYEGVEIGTVTGGTNGAPLVITFTSGATQAAVAALLGSVGYENTSDTPTTAARVVSWTLVDGDGVENAGADTATAATTIAVVANNDPPLIGQLSADVLAYTESSGLVRLDQGVAAVVTDPDSPDFAGGTLVVSITGNGVPAEDQLSIAATATVGFDGTNITVLGNVIGTATGGTNGNDLTINLNSSATPTTVAELLNALAYSNSSLAPDTTQRIVEIALNDGDGSANNGVALGTATVTINLAAINAPPVISNLNGDQQSYVENTGVQPLDQDDVAGLADVDSPNFDTGTLTIAFQAGSIPAEDSLWIVSGGDISVLSGTISYQGSAIGSVTGGGPGGAPLEIEFNNAATPTAVAALLRAVSYSNSSDTPTTTPREVAFTLDDGDGTANGGGSTTTAVVTINVTPANDAPVIGELGGILSYTENQGTLDLDQGLVATVSDIDSSDFAGGVLAVTVTSGAAPTQDQIAIRTGGDISVASGTVSHQGTAIGTVSGGTAGVPLEVSLNGLATQASVAALLNAITYTNVSDGPTTANRVITFSLQDGDGTAHNGTDLGLASVTIQLAAINDPPTLVGLTGGGVFTEGGSSVVVDGDVTLVDHELAEANDHAGATVLVTRQGGAHPDDVFSFHNLGTPSFTVGVGVLEAAGSPFATFSNINGELSIEFGPGSTTALVNDVLQRIVYANAGTVLPASVTLTYSVSDGNSGNAQGTGDNPGTFSGDVVVAINRLPSIENLGGGATYVEDGAAVPVDTDASLFDDELNALDNYAGASLTVTRQGGAVGHDLIGLESVLVSLSGNDVVVGGEVVATLTIGPGSTLALTFTSEADAAIANEVLRAVTFQTSDQNPSASVTLEYTFSDGFAVATGSAEVSITPVNDAPQVENLAGDTLIYVENSGAVAIDQNVPAAIVHLDSPDLDTGSLTVAITAGGAPAEDTLSILSTGAIAVDGTNVTFNGVAFGSITSSGTGLPLEIQLNSQANPASVTALLQAIAYANNSDVPTSTSRTVVFTLVDGDGTENNGTDTSETTATIEIRSVNDAPTLNELGGDTLSYTENSGPQVIDQGTGVAITDIDSLDFANGMLAVSVTGGGSASQDVLGIQSVGDITVLDDTVSYLGTEIGTFSGGANGLPLEIALNGSASVAGVAALLQAISYENVSDAPTSSDRHITFALTDGDGTDDGGSDTGMAVATVTIAGVNDAPSFVDLDASPVFNQGGTPIVLDADATLFDDELVAADDYAGAVLAINRDGGANSSDLFSFNLAGTPGFTVGAGVLQSEGSPFATFILAGGQLVVQFDVGSTAALVNEVMQRIAYKHAAGTLPDSVTLLYSAHDGNTADAQGSGDNPGTTSGLVTVVINELPVFSDLDGGSNYSEGGTAALVDDDATITDPELTTADNFAGAVLSVARQGGAVASDVLGLGSANVSVAGSNVMVGATHVATLTQGPGPELSLTFTGDATAAAANEVLRAITYSTTEQAPPASVTLSYTFHDGSAETTGQATVQILAANNAPEISDLGALQYVENSGPQLIAQLLPVTISDVDSPDFNNGSLTVEVTDGAAPAEDVFSIQSAGDVDFDGLNLSYAGTLIGGVSGGSNGAPLVINFTSGVSHAAVAAILASITYENTSDIPSLDQRIVTFSLNDGDGNANGGNSTGIALGTIDLSPINDAPFLTNLGGDTLSYTENDGAVTIDQPLGAIVADVDSTSFAGGTLTVALSSGVDSEDVLTILELNGIALDNGQVSYLATEVGTFTGGSNGESLVVTLNGSADVAAVTALLRSIAYNNISESPSTNSREVVFTLTDGGGTANGGTDTISATATIQVTAVNDAPEFVGLNGGNTFTEGGSPIVIDADATIVDPELDALNNYAGAAITVARSGGQSLNDDFGFNLSGTPSFTVLGNQLRAGGSAFATFSNVSGLFFLSFTSSGTPATSALVNEVLQRLTYRNSGTSLPTSVTLFVTLSDGNAGAQGTGDAPGTDTANPVIAINKLPVFSNLNGGAVFQEDGPAVAVDTNVTVSDLELDNAGSYVGSTLTVVRQGGASVHDEFGLASLDVAVLGTGVLASGTLVAALTQPLGSTLQLQFNANATPALVDQVLQAVTYRNTNPNPATSVTLSYTFSDGSVGTTGTASVTITPVNDAPIINHLNNDDLGYIVLTVSGNAPPQRIDQGTKATVTDSDSVNFNLGNVTVSITAGGAPSEDKLSIQNAGTGLGEIGFDGTTVRYQGVVIGTAVGGTGGNSLVITLNNSANAPAVAALLSAVTYENLSATPTGTSRTVEFAVNDGDGTALGGSNTGTATATVSLRPINDPPTVNDLHGDTLAYVEGAGPQRIDQNVAASVSDPDSANFGGGSVTVAIVGGLSASEDVLSVVNHGNITVSGNTVLVSGTPIGTIAGGSNGDDLVITLQPAATLAAVGELLSAISYENTSVAPNTVTRQLEFTVVDGDGILFGGNDSATVSAAVTLSAVNNGPELNNVNGGGIYSNGAAPALIDTDAFVSDVELDAANDYAGASITAMRNRGENPDDLFDVASGTNFTAASGVLKSGGLNFGTYASVDGILTVTFDSSETTATAALVNEVLQHLTYQNISPVLPMAIQLQITFSDGNTNDAQGTGLSPGTDSGVATLSVNQAPVFMNLDGGVVYFEDGPAVAIDANAVVADAEMDSFNDYTGASLTAVLQGGLIGEDVLSLGSAFVSLAGSNVLYNGTIVATLSQGPGTILSLTFNANATSISADRVLQAVTYSSSNQNPLTNVSVDFQFSDGLGSTSGSVAVARVQVNDGPTVSQSSALIYTENSGPQRIDQLDSAVVSDVDSPDFDGGSLTIAITAGGASSEDVLSIAHTGNGLGEVGFNGTDVSYEGVVIGSAAGGTAGQPLVIQWNELATTVSIAAVMQQVTYENTSDVPDVTPRAVTFTLVDGDGVANNGTDSGSTTAQITVLATNDSPVIAHLDGDVVDYTENVGAELIDQGASAVAEDVDSADLAGGSLTISVTTGAVPSDDVLTIIPGGGIGISGTDVSFQNTLIGTVSGGTGGVDLVITFNASATLAAASALLRAIGYEDVSDTPTAQQRSVVFALNDGDGIDVGTATATIEFTTVNDAPGVSNLNGDILEYTENDGLTPIDVGASAAVQDTDSPDFEGGSLTVAIASLGSHADDVLAIIEGGDITLADGAVLHQGTPIGSVSGGLNGVPLTISFTDAATPARVSSLLHAIGYRNTSHAPASSRSIELTLIDGDGTAEGGNDTTIIHTTVNITPVNDPPSITFLAGDVLGFTENSQAQLIDQGTLAVVADFDSVNLGGGSLSLSIVSGGTPAEDILAIQNGGPIAVVGANVQYLGTVIGTVLGGSGGVPLTIELNDFSTPAGVAAILNAVTYVNHSHAPVAGQRQIAVTLNDGDGTNNGGVPVATVTATVQVTAVNDAPVIQNLAGETLNYVEGSAALHINQGGPASVTDVDSVDLSGGSLTVSWAAGNVPTEDLLTVLPGGSITLELNDVKYLGTTFGIMGGGANGSPLVINFVSSATPTSLSALLNAIAYTNTSVAPTAQQRLVVFTVNDGDGTANGGVSVAAVTATIGVSAVNSAPVLGDLNGDSSTYLENSGSHVIDQGDEASVSDIDSANFANGSLTLAFVSGAIAGEDSLAVQHTGDGSGEIGAVNGVLFYEGTPIGTYTGGTLGTPLAISLNAAATTTAVSALVRSVVFENTSNNPDSVDRVISWTLIDGDGDLHGGADTATALTTVTITPVNDPPVILNLDGDSFSYEESSGPVVIDHALAATVQQVDSPDFDGGSLTVTILSGGVPTEDILSIVTAGDISFDGTDVLHDGVLIGTATGGSNGVPLVVSFTSAANATTVSALLQQVTYENTSAIPTSTTRQVAFTLVDGDGTVDGGVEGTTVTTLVHLLPVNAPPVLVDLEGDGLVYTENFAPQVIDQGTSATLIDFDSADFDTGSVTVSVLLGGVALEDVLSIAATTDIDVEAGTVRYQGTAIGTVSGGSNGEALVIALNGFANETSVAALLQAVAYSNASDSPTLTPRIVTFTVIDGDGTDNNGDDTGTATATVNLLAVNDPPLIADLDGGNTFTEGGPSVVIDADVTVSDVELEATGSYAGFLVSVARQGGSSPSDLFGFDTTGGASFTVGAGILESGGSSFATFTNAAGVLSIEFTFGATGALVNDVLRRVTYAHAAGVLPTSVELTYLVQDGNSGDAQGSGDNPAVATGTASIAMNGTPSLVALDGGATFMEDGSPVLVDIDAQVTDPELGALNNFAGSSLTVSRSGGVSADDTIGLASVEVSLSDDTVLFNGLAVASLAQGPGSALVVNFNANATAAAANAVLQAITYHNANQNPPASVELSYVFHDGAASVTGTATVNITGVNDAPQVSELSTLAYLEGAGPQVIDQGVPASITDIDSADFAGGSLTVAFETGEVASEDILSIANVNGISVVDAVVNHAGVAIGTFSGGSNGSPLVVAFNASANATAVSALLTAVAYENISDNPTTTDRTLTFTVTDGDGVDNNGTDSAVVGTTIQLTAVNDAPLLSALAGDLVNFNENGAAVLLDQGTAASVADPDSIDFAGGSVTVAITAGGNAVQDVLAIQPGGNITVNGGTISHSGVPIGTVSGGTSGQPLVVNLATAATPSAVAELLRAVSYFNASDSPTATPRTVAITVTDGDGVLNGGSDTGTAVVTINVAPINDPPSVVNLSGDVLAYVEGSGAQLIDQGTGAAVTDLDSLDFAGGTLTVSITANGVADQDLIGIAAVNGISVSGSNVSHLGTVIGTVAGGTAGANLVVTFNPAATPAAVSNLIRAVNYTNTSTTPSISPRTVTFTLIDGDGTLNGGLDSATATTTITVTSVDTPETISFQNGVFPTPSYLGTFDTKIRGDNATSNFGTSNKLEMDGNPDITSMLKWDLTAVPAGSVVQSASITISVVNTTIHVFSIYEMLRPWVESQATFNVYSLGNAWQVAGGAGGLDRGNTVLATVTSPGLGLVTVNFNAAGLAVIQKWINDPATNNGIIFQNFDNASTDDLDFNSREASTPSARPKLTINYFPGSPPANKSFDTTTTLHNSNNPYDVNGDHQVSPLDALIVINEVLEGGAGEGEETASTRQYFPDVSGDDLITPRDVLLVINYLNSQLLSAELDGDGEGEDAEGEFGGLLEGAEGEGDALPLSLSASELLKAATTSVQVMLEVSEPQAPLFLSPAAFPHLADGDDSDDVEEAAAFWKEISFGTPYSSESTGCSGSQNSLASDLLSAEMDAVVDDLCESLLDNSGNEGLENVGTHGSVFARWTEHDVLGDSEQS